MSHDQSTYAGVVERAKLLLGAEFDALERAMRAAALSAPPTPREESGAPTPSTGMLPTMPRLSDVLEIFEGAVFRAGELGGLDETDPEAQALARSKRILLDALAASRPVAPTRASDELLTSSIARACAVYNGAISRVPKSHDAQEAQFLALKDVLADFLDRARPSSSPDELRLDWLEDCLANGGGPEFVEAEYVDHVCALPSGFSFGSVGGTTLRAAIDAAMQPTARSE